MAGVASRRGSSPWRAGGLEAEAAGAAPREPAGKSGKGQGRAGLLGLSVVIGSPSLLKLPLDEILLQLLPITDHKLFSKILQKQNKTQSSC